MSYKAAKRTGGREFKIPFSLKKRETRAKLRFAYIILKRKGIVKEKK